MSISKKTKSYYINSVICILIMVLFRFIPPFGSMTTMGMTVLGIFLGVLYGWLQCDMIWPSVLALILLGFTGIYDNASASLNAAYNHPMAQTMLWLLIFSAILTQSGISKQLANRLIHSKLCKGRPWVLSVFLFLCSYIMSAFGAVVAAIMITWDFIYSISEQVGYTKNDTWPKMMVVTTMFANAIGGILLPFQVGVVAIFGFYGVASGEQVGTSYYIPYLILMIIIAIACLIIYFLLCRFIVRPDVSNLKKGVDVGSIEPFTTRQKFAMFALIGVIVVTMLPSMLPAGGLKSFMNGMGSNAMILAIIAIVTIFRTKEGKPIFTFKELADNGIFWNMLFMITTAMVIGGALANDAAGFTTTLVNFFTPVFADKSPAVFAIVICVITLILTNIINNNVTGAIMVPIMYSFATKIGANPIMLTALIVLSCNVGLFLPSASAAGAILHSNKEWVSTKDIIKYVALMLLTTAIVAICVGIPVGSALFK